MKFSDGTELTDLQVSALEKISELAVELNDRRAGSTYPSDEPGLDYVYGLEIDMTRYAEEYIEAEIERQLQISDAVDEIERQLDIRDVED